ncbi:MAG: hypothetical protein HZC28_16785 [Spirochaetes bacterium]|nr:hypothetical protein [Spirochaetota bacterium]
MHTTLKALLICGTAASLAFGGAWDASITAAEKFKDRVITRYEPGRGSFVIANDECSFAHELTREGARLVTRLAAAGASGPLLTNSMDLVIVDAAGKEYRTSLSETPGRMNMFRHGMYYAEVNILDLAFASENGAAGDVIGSLPFDGSQAWKCNDMTGGAADGVFKGTVKSTKDPYFYATGLSITLPENGPSSVRLRMRVSGSGSARIYFMTKTEPNFSGDKISAGIRLKTDGSLRTYAADMANAKWKGTVTGLRIDIDGAADNTEVAVESIDIIAGAGVPAKAQKTYHVYADRMYQEYTIHFTGDAVIKNAFFETRMISTVNDIDAGEKTTGATDPMQVRCVRLKNDNGVLTYLYPDRSRLAAIRETDVTAMNGAVTVGKDDGLTVVRQYADIGSISTFRKGQRIVIGCRMMVSAADEPGREAAERSAEFSPLEAPAFMVNTDTGSAFIGYHPLRGCYTVTSGGSDFNTAFYKTPDVRPSVRFTVKNDATPRTIFIKHATKAGGLESSAVMDERGYVLPIPVQVGKNFKGENEEPFYMPGDTGFGESMLPVTLAPNASVSGTSLHLYQNWGQKPLKQISSVCFFVPYYHSSTGVTETSCWVPFYADGQGWILPDFRARSGIIWKSQPQFDSIGKNVLFRYYDETGAAHNMEYVRTVFTSVGPVYSAMDMYFSVDGGKADVVVTAVEFAQTDEHRAYTRMRIRFNDTVTVRNCADNLGFFSSKSDHPNISFGKYTWLGTDDVPAERAVDYGRTSVETAVLGKNMPYAAMIDFTGKPERSPHDGPAGACVGVFVKKSDIVIGGKPYTGNLAFSVKKHPGKVTTGTLTLAQKDVTFTKGDTIDLDMILLPFGSHLTHDDAAMRTLRNDYGVNDLSLTAVTGKKISGFVPSIRIEQGKTEFVITGGRNNISFKVEGFQRYFPPPAVSELVNGLWKPVVYAKNGNDGYQVYPDGQGTFGFAFTVETDGSEHRYRAEESNVK